MSARVCLPTAPDRSLTGHWLCVIAVACCGLYPFADEVALHVRPCITHEQQEVDVIKAMLFNDEQVILEWLRMTLSSQADIEIEGEAMTAREMLELVQSGQPDVLVMGVPADANLVDVVRELQARPGPPRILVLTSSADAAQVQEILKAGVLGCCLRGDDPYTSSRPSALSPADCRAKARRSDSGCLNAFL